MHVQATNIVDLGIRWMSFIKRLLSVQGHSLRGVLYLERLLVHCIYAVPDYGPAICVHLGRLWLKIKSTYINQFAWPAILNVFDM